MYLLLQAGEYKMSFSSNMKSNNRLSLIFYIPPASKIRYFVPGEKASKQDLPPVTILSLGICLQKMEALNL
jgi:hypothetical protein